MEATAVETVNDKPNYYGLKVTSTILVFLLTMVTGGVYACYWFWSRRTAINALSSPKKVKVPELVILTALSSMMMLFYVCAYSGIGILFLHSIAGFIVIVSWVVAVMLLVQSFRIKGILEAH